MAKQHRKNYYAVIRGNIGEPTIFSSWGDTEPRVTGCDSEYKRFSTLEGAQDYMRQAGIDAPRENIKPEANKPAPGCNRVRYYAVAYGRIPGVYTRWYGQEGAKAQVDKVPGACHQSFDTKEDAEAFIKDRKQSVLAVRSRANEKAPNRGSEPRSAGQDTRESISSEDASREMSGSLGLEALKIEE